MFVSFSAVMTRLTASGAYARLPFAAATPA